MSLQLNQVKQIVVQGELSEHLNACIIPCQVASGETVALIPGQAVLIVDDAGGVPKVTKATSDAGITFGFVIYNQKDKSFAAGSRVEIAAFHGSCMYMTASAAIARGARVAIVVSGTKIVTRTSSMVCIGIALDKATTDGDLVRVMIDLPGIVA